MENAERLVNKTAEIHEFASEVARMITGAQMPEFSSENISVADASKLIGLPATSIRAGIVYCSSGTFSGRLDSQTGNIAGWDISSEGLSAAKMKIYSNKSINANDSPDDIFTDDPYTRIYKDGITTDQIFANEINFTPKKGSTYYKGTTKTVTVVTDVSGSTVKSTKLTFIDGMLVHETV